MDIDELRRNFVHGEAEHYRLNRPDFDRLMAEGWRNFGCKFFRYNLGFHGEDLVHVIPLRVQLSELKLSQSQKRILKRNVNLQVTIEPINITDEVVDLFFRHRERFTEYPPENIYIYLSDDPANRPVEGKQFNVRDGSGKLLALGITNVGEDCLSAVYSCFEPTEKSRSLGIFLMLKEIEYAQYLGMSYYYHGYAYDKPSYYDYKKRFTALEAFDWKGNWLPFERQTA
ncbi:MAG: arginine-tRNA-protein transferase [Acidobacteriota bacterium]|nr:MAG: arginine-tRNA-protein transferase [Acidobacteriota bacterium]